jgi:hypothetical protein
MKKADKADKLSVIMDRLLAEIKLEDLLIMSAGALAGSQGYTPLSALIKGMSGGQAAETGVDPLKLAVAAFGPGIGLAYNWPLLLGPLGPFIGLAVGQFVKADGTPPTETEKEAITKTMALASVGMIEAYAITRPGAIQGIADLVGSIAGVIQGVGSNAAAAAVIPK